MSLLAITSCVLFVLLCVSLYFNFKFGVLILKTIDALEESLDILDERYRAMSEISKRPVFFDSLEIRQMISEITKSRDAILYIANLISYSDEDYVKKLEDISDEKS